MKKLTTLLSVLGLTVWMVGCAPEEAAPPADTTTTAPEAGHDDDMHEHTPAATDEAPPADEAPEAGSNE